MIDPKLQEKVVFITGANHGIGAATAKALAVQGTRIFITYYITDSPFHLLIGEMEAVSYDVCY